MGIVQVLKWCISTVLQFLEKDNTRLESEMKDLLMELNKQKEENNLMHDEITQLEMNLKNSKVFEIDQ